MRWGAAAAFSLVLTGLILSAAYAEGGAFGGCVGTRGAVNCAARWGVFGDPFVRSVPPPIDDVEKAHASERDRRWELRCRPVIVQDIYGVARYRYAAPGCEFGIVY